MAAVIAIGTLLLLYTAQGYYVDRKNGELIQNGIVFVDSKPKGATIFVNDVAERSKTDTRLVLPAGPYTIRIEAEGYRTWQRSFNLAGGQIERLVYPLLVPNVLTINDVQVYDASPQLATQSPDRRWLLVQRPGQTYRFDVFDLLNPDESPRQVALPVLALTKPAAEATLEIVEWSTDNRHILIRRNFEGTSEYLIIDRENPDASINLNTLFGITPAKVSLKDKRPDQIYYLDTIPGVLRSGDTKAKTISAPLVSVVSDYKSYGNDILLYVTTEGAETGKADFKIVDGGKTYLLKSLAQADAYALDVSKYEDEWYYVVGSAGGKGAYVYKNPVAALKSGSSSPLQSTVLGIDNPRFASFSANTQFIALQNGKSFATLDLEYDRQYRFDITEDIPAAQKISWMDGHRLVYVHNQQSYMVDFDNSNKQTLVTTSLMNGPFFDRDYDNIFTIETSKRDATKTALTITVIDPR